MDAFAADMSCQTGVRALAAAVRSAYPRLDVLVHNVGGFWATKHLTADGLERTFAVNHLAACLLTGLVLDRLKGSAPARIVTVSSNAQAAGRLNVDDLQGERSYSGQRAYSQSKLARCRRAGTGFACRCAGSRSRGRQRSRFCVCAPSGGCGLRPGSGDDVVAEGEQGAERAAGGGACQTIA